MQGFTVYSRVIYDVSCERRRPEVIDMKTCCQEKYLEKIAKTGWGIFHHFLFVIIIIDPFMRAPYVHLLFLARRTLQTCSDIFSNAWFEINWTLKRALQTKGFFFKFSQYLCSISVHNNCMICFIINHNHWNDILWLIWPFIFSTIVWKNTFTSCCKQWHSWSCPIPVSYGCQCGSSDLSKY